MASKIEVGDTVYLGEQEVTISNIDDWVTPYRYYFNLNGDYIFCHREDLTKRKPKKIMRQYILIKTYPGSPKLGTKIYKNGQFWQSRFATENVDHFHQKAEYFQPELFEDNWEEIGILDCDFEVISFMGTFKDKPAVFAVRANGRLLRDIESFKGMNADDSATHWLDAEAQGYTIHSVKRISDGEIFTVGDKIKDGYFKIIERFKMSSSALGGLMAYDGDRGTAISILIKSDEVYGFEILEKVNSEIVKVKRIKDGEIFQIGDTVSRHKDEHCSEPNTTPRTIQRIFLEDECVKIGTPHTHSHYILSVFSHVRTFLFTTEDGVDIYEGDYWWYVKVDNAVMRKTKNFKYFGDPAYKKPVKRFSTEELAKAYAVTRRVIFVTTDGVEMRLEDTFWCPQINFDGEYLGIVLAIEVTLDCLGINLGSTKTFSNKHAAEKYFAPNFTTEDGIDIYEGDSYWCVNTAPHLWSLFEQTAKERTMLNKTVVAFYKKKNAKRFLLLNKPLLSGQDVIDYTESKAGALDDIDPDFIKLLKSKQCTK